MIRKFISQPYQLDKNKKWIPAGTIIGSSNDSSSVKITEEVQFRDKESGTKEEADKFFIDYWTKQGYSKN